MRKAKHLRRIFWIRNARKGFSNTIFFIKKKVRRVIRLSTKAVRSAKRVLGKVELPPNFFRRASAATLAFIMVFSTVFYFFAPTGVLGQTYTLIQNDWSGGTSASTVAAPSNLTGHSQYASASGVTAGAGSVALTQSNTSVSDSFTATTNRDAANTTAAWSGSGAISAQQYAATNLSAALTSAGINNYEISTISVDPSNGMMYFGGEKNNGAADLFGKYDPTSGVAVDLTTTSGLAGFMGSNSVGMMAVENGKVYLTGWYNLFAVFDPATGLATNIYSSSGMSSYIDYLAWIGVDSTRHRVYLSNAYGDLAFLDTSTGTATDVTTSSGLSAIMSATLGFTIDPSNGNVYIASSDAKFAVYNPSSGLATNLSVTSGHTTIWNGRVTSTLVYSQVDSKVYLLGRTNAYVPVFASYDTITGIETNISSTSGIVGADGSGQNTTMEYDSVNGKIYIGSYWSSIYSYTPGVAGSIVVLDDSVSGLSNIDTSVSALAIDSSRGRLFIGNNSALVGLLSIPPSSSVATSITLDSTLQNIASATLTKNDTVGTGTIGYQLSADGGAHWETVTPSSQHTFSNLGSDLRFRISLTGNATVQDVSITYYYYPAAGELVSSKFDGQDPTTVVNLLAWNENASLPSGTSVVASLRTAATADGLDSAPWINLQNAKPASTPSSVSESFTTTDNRDSSNTTASWSGSGQIAASGYVPVDLTSVAQAAGVSDNIRSLALDQSGNAIYFGSYDETFFRYDIGSNTVTNLTASSGLSTIWGNFEYDAPRPVFLDGKVYLTSSYYGLAVYDPATGNATDLTVSSGLNAIGAPVQSTTAGGKLYMGTNYGHFMVYNPATGLTTDLTDSSGLNAFWPSAYGDVVYSAYDSVGNKLYLHNGDNAAFAVFDIATGLATNLAISSGLSSFWTSTYISGMVYSPVQNKVYIAGDGSFAVYDPVTGLATNLTTTVGYGTFNTWAIAYDPGNDRVYLGSAGNYLLVYTPGSPGSIEDVTWTLNPVLGYNNILTMVTDTTHNILYFGESGGVFGKMNLVCASCRAVSVALDSASQNILSAALTKNDTPGTGTVAYELSNDGGSHWETVMPGALHVFSSTGSDLRFRILISGNATVQDVAITYFSAISGSAACTKTSSTVTCGGTTIPSSFQDGSNDRFFQYRLTLISDGLATPTVSSASVQFVVNAPPEVRNVTASQGANGTVTVAYEVRDPDTAGGSVGNVGYITPSFEYWDGSAWRAAATFATGDTDRKSVEMDGTTWSSYSATWSPATDFDEQYLPSTVKMRVTANDGEGANPTGSAESAVFGLDTRDPVGGTPVTIAVAGPWGSPVNDSSTNSASVTTSGASYILVGIAANRTSGSSPEQVVSVSGGGLSFSKIAGGTIPDDTAYASEYWGAYSSGALAGVTITATLNNPANIAYSIVSLTGVDSVSPVGRTLGPAKITGNLVANFSNTTAGSMLFAMAFSSPYDMTSVTAGSGTTVYANQNSATQHIRSTSPVSGGSQTISSSGWGASTGSDYAGVEILPAHQAASVYVDASVSPQLVHLSASDNSTLYMKVSKTDATLASTASEAYSTTKSMVLDSADTVYVRYIDAYANASSILSANTPTTLASVIIQDVSNLTLSPAQYQLFLAWKAAVGGSFGSYQVYRSANQAAAYPWTLVATISQQNTNYYLDQGLSEGSTYYYYVVNVDSLGNRSNRSSVVYGTANGTQDGGEGGGGTANPPVITSVASSALSTSATISWNTDTLSSSTVRYSTSPSVFTSSATVGSLVNNASGVGRHEVILSGLAPNTTYYYEVQSTDTADQTTTDANGGTGYTFTTAQGPVISSTTVVSVTNNTAKIAWTTDTLSTTQAVYSIHSDLSAPTVTSGTSDPTLHHEVTIGNLLSNTRYYFYVRSVDASSNETVDANIIDGQVLYYSLNTTNDQQAPTISSVSASTRTDSADIVWTTDELADSQVDYGLTNAYGSTSNLDSAMTLRHIVTLGGLDPATTYYYRVKSRDVNGNLANGSELSFTTPQSDDVTPPVISSVGTTGISLTGATVNWTTNEAATSFVEYGTTTSLGQGTGNVATRATGHSVSLSQLSPNQQYYFKVHSEDAAGNAATDDNSGDYYTFTTSADTTAPSISSVGTVLVSDTSAVITWLTDEPATSTINYGADTSYGQQTSSSSGPSTSHSVTITGLTKQTAYRYRVVSADASGNSATDDNSGAGYSFTTTDAPGQIISGGRGPTRDTDPPSILNLQVGSIGKTSASVTWTTSEAASTILKYGTTIAYGSLAGSIDEQLSAHQVDLSGLKPGTVYHFIAVSIDPSGNQGGTQDRQFATLNEDGTQVPIPPQPEVLPPPEDVPTNTNTPTEEAPEIEPSAKIIGVLADLLKNPDLSNIPEQPFINTVNEIIDRVVRPPVIVGIAPKIEVTGTTAMISWTTDKKSTGSVAYAPENGFDATQSEPYLALISNPGELSNMHEVLISNLEPATKYHFQVRSKGLVGGEAKSVDMTFSTTSDLPIISGLRVLEVNDLDAVLSWSTNVPTTTSVSFKDIASGKELTQGDNDVIRDHKFKLEKLSAGRGYSFTITATDEYGNKAVSKPLALATSKDSSMPVISKVTSTSALYPGKQMNVQTIITWTTDEPATSHVYYQEGLAGDAQQIEVPLDPALVTAHTVVITKFRPMTVYKFHVESTDAAGNLAKSNDFLILTPQQKASVLDLIIGNFENVFGWTKKLK